MHLSYPIAIAPCFVGQSVNDLLVSRVPVDVCCYFRGGINTVRGHVHMTEGEGVTKQQTRVLISCVSVAVTKSPTFQAGSTVELKFANKEIWKGLHRLVSHYSDTFFGSKWFHLILKITGYSDTPPK